MIGWDTHPTNSQECTNMRSLGSMIHKKDVYVSDIQPFANYSTIKISFIRMMKEQKFKFHLIYYLRKGDKKGFE